MQGVIGSNPFTSTLLYVFFIHLYSTILNQYYIGHTKNIQDRLFRHNNSGSKSTKKANDWKVVYTEQYQLRSEAYKRESEIKRKKSRNYIEYIIRIR